MIKAIVVLAIVLPFMYSPSTVMAQANTYAAVTGVAGSVVTLKAGHSGAFVVGEQAMIMQMKGAVISENNDANYGLVTDDGGAGQYSFATVLAVNGDDITLDIQVNNFNAAGYIQLISIAADDGSGNYQEDGSGFPPPWDGFTGGVYAMAVCNDFVLTSDLGIPTGITDTDNYGGGFRGGLTNGLGDFYGSFAQQWVAEDVDDFEFGAFKGEGVASTYCDEADLGEGVPLDILQGTSSGGWAYNYLGIDGMGNPGELCSVHDIGSGAIANGGGSGTMVDGGGGGGGNGGMGGAGGCGWAINFNDACGMGKACNGCTKEMVQGVGGYGTPAAPTLVKLGGGGGSGWTDAQVDADMGGAAYFGGQGYAGGIAVVISAADVVGNGYTIYADGKVRTSKQTGKPTVVVVPEVQF